MRSVSPFTRIRLFLFVTTGLVMARSDETFPPPSSAFLMCSSRASLPINSPDNVRACSLSRFPMNDALALKGLIDD
ncbi:hypothetical protein O9993_12100 [Vibrio lentus]|nr:hypothetical protein [Vibrio lentus]